MDVCFVFCISAYTVLSSCLFSSLRLAIYGRELNKKKTTKPLHCDSIETSCLYTVQELQVAAITACFICTTFMARPLINLNIFVNERMHNWWKQSFLIAAGLWNHLLEVIAIEGSRYIREISFHVTPVERGCLTNMLHAGLIIFYF